VESKKQFGGKPRLTNGKPTMVQKKGQTERVNLWMKGPVGFKESNRTGETEGGKHGGKKTRTWGPFRKIT